ncbi:MAG: hypothetical protein DMG05_17040 [Acidobacteria bacterium]|nr:MAG: hypothetical protein DMG05_17040 [Acidobacteriota bacterium]
MSMAQSVSPERDGFQVTQRHFKAPPNTTFLDPVAKRKVTICNLFSNHGLSMRDIVRVLDESYGRVVNTLIEQGLVYERRKGRAETQPKVDRRHSFFNKL